MKKNLKLNFPDLDGSKRIEVLVTLLSKVKLSEGFFGICSFFFPQYLINAILLGASHFDSYGNGPIAFEIKKFYFIFISKIGLQLKTLFR